MNVLRQRLRTNATTIVMIHLLLSIFLFSCADEERYSGETGAATFSIKWPDNMYSNNRLPQALNNPSIDCNQWSIATVEVNIYNEADQFLIGDSFPCTRGSGTVIGIPVGSNRTFIVSAKTLVGGLLYQGDIHGVEIVGDSVTECGSAILTMADSDNDGVPDGMDNCPNTPVGETVDEDGCSPAQPNVDSDNDGVADVRDACPDTPAGEPADTNGCSASQRDTDEDGVLDSLDTCPNTPLEETPDANGCSASQRDTDGDGVVDSVDACPNTLSGVAVDQYGCEQSDGLINAYYTSTAITIDGAADEWTDVPGFQITSADSVTLYSELSVADNDQDCSAVFRVVWDEQNLYIMIQVTDDVLNKDSGTISQDDSVEVYIDGGDENATSYDSNDSHLLVDIENNIQVVGNNPSLSHVVSTSESSYVVECAIPISDIGGLQPYAGESFGFDVAINDDDNIGDNQREHHLVWHGDGTGWLDPRQFGTITLRKKAGE